LFCLLETIFKYNALVSSYFIAFMIWRGSGSSFAAVVTGVIVVVMSFAGEY